jgi:hypothetical protein
VNNAQLYLAWLRTNSPDVYLMAMRKTLGQPRTLGGLDSDLVNSMTAPATFGAFGQDSSSDTSLPSVTVSPDTFAPQFPLTDTSGMPLIFPVTEAYPTAPEIPTLTPEQLAPVTVEAAPAPVLDASGTLTGTPPDGTSWLTSLITAVGNIGATALSSSSQSNLVKLNTARAQQGLPPVDINGRVVTASGLAPATSAIYRLEQAIAGGTTGATPLLLIAGVGLLAFLFMRRK